MHLKPTDLFFLIIVMLVSSFSTSLPHQCFYCLLHLLPQEIGRLTLEANRTADGVLALERGIMALQDEAREMEGRLQRKALEIDTDATMAQEVSEQCSTF